MGDTGFRVQPEALGRYASMITEQLEQLQRIQSAVAAVTISSDAFGHLPNAQHLAQAYQEHASAGSQNLSDLGQALDGTSEGLTYTARNYVEHERGISATYGGGA